MEGRLACNVQAMKKPVICQAIVMRSVIVRLYWSIMTCGAILPSVCPTLRYTVASDVDG